MAELNYQNKKALESQKKIYKSLRRILLTKPLSEVTISDIKAECNISRSTFYRNFSNVVDVLDVMLNYFYERYLKQKVEHKNQLLFFFEYWYNHRDLIHIISHQNEGLIKKCIVSHENTDFDNIYLIDLKYSILTSLLSRWSESKKESPQQMEQLTRNLLNQKCIDILLKEQNE